MRIDKKVPDPTTALVDAAQAGRKSPSQSEAPSTTLASDAHQASPDFLKILETLQTQVPDARQGVLQEVAQRIASGFYLTPQAAELAAKAIAAVEG
jgi:hypothetical protein